MFKQEKHLKTIDMPAMTAVSCFAAGCIFQLRNTWYQCPTKLVLVVLCKFQMCFWAGKCTVGVLPQTLLWTVLRLLAGLRRLLLMGRSTMLTSWLKSCLKCSLKTTRNEHGYFNGGGSTVSEIEKGPSINDDRKNLAIFKTPSPLSASTILHTPYNLDGLWLTHLCMSHLGR